MASPRVRGLTDRLLDRSRVRFTAGYRVLELSLAVHPLSRSEIAQRRGGIL